MRLTVPRLDPRARIGDVAVSVRRLLNRAMWPLTVVAAYETGILFLHGSPAALAFILISSSSLVASTVWVQRGEGLPIIPLLILQNLVIYGLPIVIHNESILGYSPTDLTRAGWEVFLCNITMIVAWRIAMEIVPAYGELCYALQGFATVSKRLTRIGLTLLIVSTGYDVLQSTGLLDPVLQLLPTGSDSITHVIVSGANACGFFLTGMMVGRGRADASERTIFWVLLTLECFISAAGFLLSAAATIVFAAIIGLFWGSGRIPWRFVMVTVSALAFLNLGKFTMRQKYWHPTEDQPQPQFTLAEMPRYYGEWIEASIDAVTDNPPDTSTGDSFNRIVHDNAKTDTDQSLLSRINNLQNLLFVIDAMGPNRVAPLNGATYTLIPPLLVPRVLWPNKPRSHEGQVLLNVHFGRQDLYSTYQTYVAWGLLPEAYGNFGPLTGAILLGAFLGAMFAWVERFVARKLLLSMEGFLSFTIFLGMANSFEMVASVLVTSVFQACVPIVLASAPFVARVLPSQPREETVNSNSVES